MCSLLHSLSEGLFAVPLRPQDGDERLRSKQEVKWRKDGSIFIIGLRKVNLSMCGVVTHEPRTGPKTGKGPNNCCLKLSTIRGKRVVMEIPVTRDRPHAVVRKTRAALGSPCLGVDLAAFPVGDEAPPGPQTLRLRTPESYTQRCCLPKPRPSVLVGCHTPIGRGVSRAALLSRRSVACGSKPLGALRPPVPGTQPVQVVLWGRISVFV